MTEPQRALPDPEDGADESEADQPRRAAEPGHFRWAMVWTALGALIPGLGLWHAGRRVAGSIAMGLFAALLLTLGYLGFAGRDRILALDMKGVLYLIRANPEKLEIIDEKKLTSEECWAHLAVDGRTLYIRELKALVAYEWGGE